ncbi:hypothetical protein SGLAM104S_07145 [Streptomyces glaucescens]
MISPATSPKSAFGSSLPLPSTTTISGPLKPGPEALREEVVGAALGGRGRLGAVVGQAEFERGGRDRCGAEADDAEQQHGDRAADDEAGPQRVPMLGLAVPSAAFLAARPPPSSLLFSPAGRTLPPA